MTADKKNVITIDGPAASGKSSLSRELARRLSWKWVSTGAFYRAIAHLAHQKNVDAEDENALLEMIQSESFEVRPDPIQTQVFIDGRSCSLEEIYSIENGTRASNLSRFPKVREAILDRQREVYEAPGLIAEGRDCGTVIFPQADLKIYLVADEASRALRRAEEKQDEQALEQVGEALKKRDQQDRSRAAAPMEAAEDAVLIDSTNLSLEEVVDTVYTKAKSQFSL